MALHGLGVSAPHGDEHATPDCPATPDIDPSDGGRELPQESSAGPDQPTVATVLKKLQKWGDYPAWGDVVQPTKFIPMKTPLSEEILSNWSLPEQPRHRLTVSQLLAAQKEAGREVGMLLDLSNHDCLYTSDIPEGICYEHIKLVAKELPPPAFVEAVCVAANAFWEKHPHLYIAVHCAYGFNRTGFVLACYLVQECRLSVDQALDAFKTARPPGVKHQEFRAELRLRYEPAPPSPPAPAGPCTARSETQASEEVAGEDDVHTPLVPTKLQRQQMAQAALRRWHSGGSDAEEPVGLAGTLQGCGSVGGAGWLDGNGVAGLDGTPAGQVQGQLVGATPLSENDSLGPNRENDSLGLGDRVILQGLRAHQMGGGGQMTPAQLEGLLSKVGHSPGSPSSALGRPPVASTGLSRKSLGEIQWSVDDNNDPPKLISSRSQPSGKEGGTGGTSGGGVTGASSTHEARQA